MTVQKFFNNIETESFKYSLDQLGKVGIILDTKNRLLLHRFDRIFCKYLPKGNLSFIELGCAPGPFMIYFNKNFGYHISGIESSRSGVEVTKKNFQINKVHGKLICDDIMNLSTRKKFDIVFSAGFLEHFKNYKKVFDIHYKLAKNNGFLIVSIPNYEHLNRTLLQFFNPSYLKIHNLDIAQKPGFEELIRSYKMKILFFDYIGTFYWDIYDFPFMRGPTNFNRNCKIHRITTKILKKVHFESGIISPVILLIAQKIK